MADLERTYMWLFGWFVSLIAAVMYVYSTVSPYWHEVVDDKYSHGGLWYKCDSVGETVICQNILMVGVEAYIHFARAFMICASLFILCILWTLLIAHVVKVLSNKLKVAGILIMLTIVPVLLASVMYTSLMALEMEKKGLEEKPGHAVILAWLSLPVALVGGALLVMEHKRLRSRMGYLKL